MSPSIPSPSSQTRRSGRGISLPWTSASRSRPSFALPARHSPEWTPLLASGALVLVLALQLALPYRTELPGDSGLAPRRPRPFAEPQLPTYSTLLQAPIFAPDRAPGGSGGAANVPGALDDVTVVGIAVARGAATAVVSTAAGSQAVKLGGVVEGWRLVGVDPRHLAFVRGTERKVLTLDPKKAAAAKGPAAKAAQTSQSDDDEDDQ